MDFLAPADVAAKGSEHHSCELGMGTGEGREAWGRGRQHVCKLEDWAESKWGALKLFCALPAPGGPSESKPQAEVGARSRPPWPPRLGSTSLSTSGPTLCLPHASLCFCCSSPPLSSPEHCAQHGPREGGCSYLQIPEQALEQGVKAMTLELTQGGQEVQ